MPKQTLTYKVYFEDDVYSATVDVTYHVDGNYGADADGNRGYPHLFIDDARIVKVTNSIDDIPPSELPDELKQKILEAIDEHI